jgi:DnaJ-class molecular chaperone
MTEICTTCDGKGQTKETATIVREVSPKIWVTKQRGSGCPVCLGTGVKEERKK